MISCEEEPFPTMNGQIKLITLVGRHLLDFFCDGKSICVRVIGNNQGHSFLVCSLHGKIQSSGLFGVWELDSWEIGIGLFLRGDRHEVQNP